MKSTLDRERRDITPMDPWNLIQNPAPGIPGEARPPSAVDFERFAEFVTFRD